MSMFEDIASAGPSFFLLENNPKSPHSSLGHIHIDPGVDPGIDQSNFPRLLTRIASLLNGSSDALKAGLPPLLPTLAQMASNQLTSSTLKLLDIRVAQDVVDTLQKWLDSASWTEQDRECRLAIYALVKIVRTTGRLPASLFLTGVDIGSLRDAVAQGGYGDIFKGVWRRHQVAIKRIRVSTADKEKLERALCKEALIWKQLDHPHVLRFLGVDLETFSSTGFMGLVMPWLSRGTLLQFIRSPDFDVCQRNSLLYQVAEGLAYLHSLKIVHGDINGNNILIDDRGQACLADFGLTVVGDDTIGRITDYSCNAGSVRWMSPERLDPDREDKPLQPSSDVWAFGCLCVMIYTHERPYHNIANDTKIAIVVVQGGHPSRPQDHECHGLPMPGFIWDIAEQCWDRDPYSRPHMRAIHEVLANRWHNHSAWNEHDWFSDIQSLLSSLDSEPESMSQEMRRKFTFIMSQVKENRDIFNALTSFTGENAILLLNAIQLWLDCETHDSQDGIDLYSCGIDILVKVAEHSGQLPTSLFLHGTACDKVKGWKGSSAYTDLYLGMYHGVTVAVSMFRTKFFKKVANPQSLNQHVCRVGLLWRQLKHPHVMPFLGMDMQSLKGVAGIPCMVSPWLDQRRLSQVIQNIQSDGFNPTKILYEIADALSYLHKLNVVHGDVRTETIYVDITGGARLAFFENYPISRKITRSGSRFDYSAFGARDVRFMAPEFLQPKRLHTSADVWSFGSLCLAMCTLQPPFYYITDYEVERLIAVGAIPKRPTYGECQGRPISDALWALMVECWKYDSTTRPSMDVVFTRLVGAAPRDWNI